MNYNIIISERQDRGEVITPKPLVEKMLDKLPKEVFESSTTTFLDPCFGTGTFLIAIGLRLKKYGHSSENINSRLFGFEISTRLFNSSKKLFNETKCKLRGIDIIKEDFLKANIDMKFDVIVGNPPYQNGKDKMFYINFISKAFSILKSGGIISFINPYSWVDKSLFNQMKKDGYFHHIKQEDGDEIFKISMGSALCAFVYEKESNVKGCADIEIHPKFSKDAIAQSIISKIYKNSIKPKKGKGQREFIHNQDDQHVFPIYLSSKNTENDNRTLMWSQTPGTGSGVNKLIVAHILEPGRASRFSEFSNEKGVGRYSQYFECTEAESENIKSFFDSKIYSFIDSNTRIGRYAFVELPNIDWSLDYNDDLIYSKLSQEEINYIENAVK